MDISIIIPVFNGSKTIEKLVNEINDNLVNSKNNFEIFLIDDLSGDNSWNCIENLCKKYNFVKGIKLKSNFGQHNATMAGLNYCSGDFVIIMDDDLQHNPKYILKIIDKICICSSDNSYDKICVVENLADMWVIDSANIYKGHYHILGGTLNSSENYEQKNLLIDSLVKRIRKNNLKEVIIATSATVEGQTTAHYIEDTIKSDKLKITKLAQGLPVGGEIEQLDDGTLFSAFKNRVPVTDN